MFTIYISGGIISYSLMTAGEKEGGKGWDGLGKGENGGIAAILRYFSVHCKCFALWRCSVRYMRD